MITESHSDASSDRRVELTVGSMVVVPHAAGRGDGENADSLDQGVGPKSTENEIVESNETGFGVTLN